MLVAPEPVLDASRADAAYYRARARRYRRDAGEARDAVIRAELLRLAELYERMAANAEIERKAGND